MLLASRIRPHDFATRRPVLDQCAIGARIGRRLENGRRTIIQAGARASGRRGLMVWNRFREREHKCVEHKKREGNRANPYARELFNFLGHGFSPDLVQAIYAGHGRAGGFPLDTPASI